MTKISDNQLKQLVEAGIFVAEAPLSVEQMHNTFLSDFAVSKKQINKVLNELVLDYAPRGIHLQKVASGYRFVSDESLGLLLSKLWQENAPKYSRAMLETLALIAYRQPITRGEIEEIRGVSVSSHIVKSLSERNWVKVIGHKEVPGRPALLATTKTFLDYFGLSSLAQLPSAAVFEESLDAAMQAADTQASFDDLSSNEVSHNEATLNARENGNPPEKGDNGQLH